MNWSTWQYLWSNSHRGVVVMLYLVMWAPSLCSREILTRAGSRTELSTRSDDTQWSRGPWCQLLVLPQPLASVLTGLAWRHPEPDLHRPTLPTLPTPHRPAGHYKEYGQMYIILHELYQTRETMLLMFNNAFKTHLYVSSWLIRKIAWFEKKAVTESLHCDEYIMTTWPYLMAILFIWYEGWRENCCLEACEYKSRGESSWSLGHGIPLLMIIGHSLTLKSNLVMMYAHYNTTPWTKWLLKEDWTWTRHETFPSDYFFFLRMYVYGGNFLALDIVSMYHL